MEREPLSFLRIDRAETQFPDSVDTYADCVYEKAGELLQGMMEDGSLLTEPVPCYYVYELAMEGRSQTGIAACASVDDYLSGVIRKHENTRADKEGGPGTPMWTPAAPRQAPFSSLTGPGRISGPSRSRRKEGAPLYDFTAPDGVRHRVWRIGGADQVRALEEAFSRIPVLYIADGHHRAASAVRVSLKRREENPGWRGDEPFNFFLSVLFPGDELQIMDYNRAVADLNGLTKGRISGTGVRQVYGDGGGKPGRPPRKKGRVRHVSGRPLVPAGDKKAPFRGSGGGSGRVGAPGHPAGAGSWDRGSADR